MYAHVRISPTLTSCRAAELHSGQLTCLMKYLSPTSFALVLIFYRWLQDMYGYIDEVLYYYLYDNSTLST
jgi:hypothetical protein